MKMKFIVVIFSLLMASINCNQMTWTEYHKLDTIYQWMASIATVHSSNATLVNLTGTSFENRNISGIHLHPSSKTNNRRVVFLEANMHAREWITTEVATYILNQLLTSTDPKVKKLTDSYDWYIFPITNPDGFQYSHQEPDLRQWKKTRKPNGECKGADTNLNWDFHFNEFGTSTNPCDNTYPGSKAFSEPETKALSEFIEKKIGSKLEAYISFHSNKTSKILIPYGTADLADNFSELFDIALYAANALETTSGTKCIVGNYGILKNKTSGGSVDWVKEKLKTRLTLTYELRDKENYQLPPNEIIPTAKETLNSLVALFEKYEKIKKNSAKRMLSKYFPIIIWFLYLNTKLF